MRNSSWNCSPNSYPVKSSSMNVNESGRIGIDLKECENGGNCVAFELTDVHGAIERGHKCECPEGFR